VGLLLNGDLWLASMWDENAYACVQERKKTVGPCERVGLHVPVWSLGPVNRDLWLASMSDEKAYARRHSGRGDRGQGQPPTTVVDVRPRRGGSVEGPGTGASGEEPPSATRALRRSRVVEAE